MTMRPLHAALALAAIVFLGGVLGWFITRGALDGKARVALVARIKSLPAVDRLPALASGTLHLEDQFVSPGGPVWVGLLSRDGTQGGLVCRFDRASSGGVTRPTCKQSAALATGARFSVGGSDPGLLLPSDGGPLHAVHALTGKDRATVSENGAWWVSTAKGTRLVRRFKAAAHHLILQSPIEGAFIGPHVAHAILEPPPDTSEDGGQQFLCATPTGYVQGDWHAPDLTVTFSSNTEQPLQQSTHVPPLTGASPSFVCAPHLASFIWLDAGGIVRRVRCDPEDCHHEDAALGDIPSESVATLSEIGQHTVIVYERDGLAMLRLGSFAELGHSPSAPLFGEARSPATPRAKDLKFVPTGTSLLVFVEAPGVKVAQIHEDGHLEALAPR